MTTNSTLVPGKPILTKEIIAQILDCLTPSIIALLEMYGRKYLHIMITAPPEQQSEILADRAIVGKVEDYPKPYNEIARMKNELSARLKMSTDDAINKAPVLMLENDVMFQGGTYVFGYSVSASGAPAPLDQAFTEMIASLMIAYCRIYIQNLQAKVATGGPIVVTLPNGNPKSE